MDWGQVGIDAAIGAVGGALGGALNAWNSARKLGKRTTEIVQRAMSRDELAAIQKSGVLSRGGRRGDHFVSDAISSDALRARQRLALPGTPEVRVSMEVPAGVFSRPTPVVSKYQMPGGGLERAASGKLGIPVTVLRVWNY